MSPDVALRIITSRAPCEHNNVEPALHDSEYQACYDCGQIMHEDDLEESIQEAKQFQEAIRVLKERLQTVNWRSNQGVCFTPRTLRE